MPNCYTTQNITHFYYYSSPSSVLVWVALAPSSLLMQWWRDWRREMTSTSLSLSMKWGLEGSRWYRRWWVYYSFMFMHHNFVTSVSIFSATKNYNNTGLCDTYCMYAYICIEPVCLHPRCFERLHHVRRHQYDGSWAERCHWWHG